MVKTINFGGRQQAQVGVLALPLPKYRDAASVSQPRGMYLESGGDSPGWSLKGPLGVCVTTCKTTVLKWQ